MSELKITIEKVEKTEYLFKDEDDFLKARVVSENGKFKYCNYTVSHNEYYTYKDWVFISVVSDFIKREFKAEGF